MSRFAKTMTVRVLVAVLAIGAAVDASVVRAQDDDAAKYVQVHYKGDCDATNKRAYVQNTNPTKTVLAALQWHLAGGKRLSTNTFRLDPGSEVEVGCAGEVQLTSALYD
jgi:hypothetical protein